MTDCFVITVLSEEEEEFLQGSYRQDCVKFKDFSRTSQDYPTVFKD